MKNNLKWYVVDKEYVSYLKEFDDKVETLQDEWRYGFYKNYGEW